MIYGRGFLICVKGLRISASRQLKNTGYLIYVRNWTISHCSKQTNKSRLSPLSHLFMLR